LAVVPVLAAFWGSVFFPWDFSQTDFGGCFEGVGFFPLGYVEAGVEVVRAAV